MGRPEKDWPLQKSSRNSESAAFAMASRMWLVLKKRESTVPKTILRIMEKYGLLAEIRRRRKVRFSCRTASKCTMARESTVIPSPFCVSWRNMVCTGNHGARIGAQQQMGNRRVYVSVHDPGSDIQNWHRADSKSGSGHHSPGHAQGERELRSSTSTATKGFSTPRKHTLT